MYGDSITSNNNSFPNKNNAILDSGTSGHFLPVQSPQINIQKKHSPINIKQPDGNTLKYV